MQCTSHIVNQMKNMFTIPLHMWEQIVGPTSMPFNLSKYECNEYPSNIMDLCKLYCVPAYNSQLQKRVQIRQSAIHSTPHNFTYICEHFPIEHLQCELKCTGGRICWLFRHRNSNSEIRKWISVDMIAECSICNGHCSYISYITVCQSYYPVCFQTAHNGRC